jgi:hypothetical protein
MTVFEVSITDGIIGGDGLEVADLEHYAQTLFTKTRAAIDGRTKMPQWERAASNTEIADLAAAFKEIIEIGDKRSRLSAMRAVAAALALGFHHPGNAEAIRSLEASRQSDRGKKSAPARALRWPWKPCAHDLAREAHTRNPNLSPEAIATEITRGWKFADLKCPGHRTLAGFVSQLRESGELPHRTRPLRK